jgi:DMSO/TMAO reductase YedYZ molybdopterin-dependent catalytic subunit
MIATPFARFTCPSAASHRARGAVATLAQAEALADLLRDHGYPARVCVARATGAITIRTAHRAAIGARRTTVALAATSAAVRTWLLDY